MHVVDVITTYLRVPYLIAGIVVGSLALYTKEKDKRIVYVYPKPSNVEQIQYRDIDGQCFEVVQEPVPCNVVSQFSIMSSIKQVMPQM